MQQQTRKSLGCKNNEKDKVMHNFIITTLEPVALPYSDKITEYKKLADAELSKFDRYNKPISEYYNYLDKVEKVFNESIVRSVSEWVDIYGRTKIINRLVHDPNDRYQHYIENDRAKLSYDFAKNTEDYVNSNFEHVIKGIEKAEALGLWEVKNISKDKETWVNSLKHRVPAYITFYIYVCNEVKHNWQFIEMIEQFIEENIPLGEYLRPE